MARRPPPRCRKNRRGARDSPVPRSHPLVGDSTVAKLYRRLAPPLLLQHYGKIFSRSRDVRGLELDENRWPNGAYFLPSPPHIGKRGEDIRRPETARGPLPRATLRGPAERMCAQRGGLGGRSPAREERADESREQIAAASCRETGIPARNDVLRTTQVGDDGGNAFEEHGASELRRRVRGGRPAIVRRFVREGVAGEGAELAQMRRAHDGPVDLTLEIMQGVGVDHGRHRAPAQHLRHELLACGLSPESGAEHHGIRPLECFGSGWIEILTERRFDRQYIGKTRLRGGDRFAGGDQLHESRARGEGGACRAAPLMLSAPPTTHTRPRSPLCICGASRGSRSAAHASVTSTGQAASGGGKPMSTTTTLPHHSRASRWPRRGPPNVTVICARTGPCASPLVRSSPVGPSTARIGAPYSINRCAKASTSPFAGPTAPVPRSESTATVAWGHASSRPSSRTPSSRAKARLSIASSVLGSTATTHTGMPAAWSARATTQPSPPLFPAPAAISAPPETMFRNSDTSTCATARPAVSIRTRLGIRYCVRAWESHAAASLAERTGIGFTESPPPRIPRPARCHLMPSRSGGSLPPPPVSRPALARRRSQRRRGRARTSKCLRAYSARAIRHHPGPSPSRAHAHPCVPTPLPARNGSGRSTRGVEPARRLSARVGRVSSRALVPAARSP